ncbi:MAG: hypothetical protein AMJ62_10290 [Myxococcales bacterium SG8_38]|nr:MAG: hypothetical protein AMJ62_10290 [Myxococcales bacterium SG8_38]
MVARQVPGLLLAAFVIVLATSSTAHAWTRSVVGGAHAEIDLGRDATADVLLRLDVEVQAGWLRELELAGLGAGVVLDPSRPPYFRSEDGEIFRPDAEVDAEGRIRLSFSRREAPKRGGYRAFIRYESRVEAAAVEVEGQPRARVLWSLPAWETGLHDVSVELRAPKGTSTPTDPADTPAGVDVQITERPNRTVVSWRRIHLPRMTPWPLTVDVPAESLALPAAPEAPPPPVFRPLPKETRRPFVWTLLVVAMLALLKRRLVQLTMGTDLLLVRASWVAVLPIAAAIAGAAQWMGPDNLWLALPLIALALHRPLPTATVAPHEDWRAARSVELPQPKTRLADYLDATTGIGAVVLALSSACSFAGGQSAAALLLVPLFFSGTRRHVGPRADEAAELLREFASSLRLDADAPQMALSWELAPDGRPRLRLFLPSCRTGLFRLGFAVASSSNGFTWRRHVMLLVQTRAQSDADDLVRRRMVDTLAHRGPDGLITRLVEWDAQALELIRALSRRTPKPVKTSRGTWLLQEISEPSQKAA